MAENIGRSNAVKDLTKGNVLKVVLLFAVPLFLSNIFQQLYNLTDISIIGHALGDDALSAIGSVSTIYGMFNSLLFGMGNGFAMVIAKFFGAGDQKSLRKAIANTLIISVIWTVAITAIGILTLKPLMKILNTPDSIFDMAYSYAIIVISLLVFSFIYNVLSAMLRAVGNSIEPLFILMLSVTINVGLDLLFVCRYHWGLPGAAIATTIAQAISALTCFFFILRKVPELRFRKEDLKLDKAMIEDLFSAGLAFALMYTVVNIGTVILQGAINGLGETTIAAHTTARKISEFCMLVPSTLAHSMANFAGQNYGAGRYDRIKEGLRKTILFACGIATFMIFIIYTTGEGLVQGVSGSENQTLIDTAVFYLKVDLPFYYVLSVLLITRNTMQGMGAKYTPVIASIMELLFKAFTAGFLAVRLKYIGIAFFVTTKKAMDKQIEEHPVESQE